MTTSEVTLLDTNILVYAADETSEFYVPAKEIRDRGVQGDIPVAVSAQILFEFFAVITNPRRVTQPRSPQEAQEEMEKYLQAHGSLILKLPSKNWKFSSKNWKFSP